MSDSSNNSPLFSTRGLALGGMVAAIYVVLTLIFQPSASGRYSFASPR